MYFKYIQQGGKILAIWVFGYLEKDWIFGPLPSVFDSGPPLPYYFRSTKIFIYIFLSLRLGWSPYSIKQQRCGGVREYEILASWNLITSTT